MINIIFKDGNQKKYIKSNENLTILEIARRENIDLEGSCDGSLACSTCHIIISKSWYTRLSKPKNEELELLEILPNYEKNSRLGCQVKVTKDLDGIEISLPISI